MLKDRKASLLVVILSFFSLAIYYVSTVHGIGLTPDSVAYIDGARGILSQHNFTSLKSHYPPLYPIILAVSGFIGGDVIIAARWLHALIFVATVILVFSIIYKRTSDDLILAGLGTLIVALPVNVFASHIMAWSEPVFYLTLIIGLTLLGFYLEKRQYTYLFWSALVVGLAFLDRYVGVVAIGAAVVVIILYNRSWLERVKASTVFIVIASAPALLWMLHNQFSGHRATNREMVFHPITLERIEEGVSTMAGWFSIPDALSWLVPAALISILVLYAYLRLNNQRGKGNLWPLVDTLFIFSASYLLFLPISISLFDAYTPLDDRILSPFYITVMLGLILWASDVIRSQLQFRHVRTIIILSMVLIAGLQLGSLRKHALYAAHNGFGYSSQLWRESPLLKSVASVPKNIIIYTNVPEPVKLYLDRDATMLPRIFDPVSKRINQEYESAINELIGKVKARKAIVVCFSAGQWRNYLPTPEQLVTHYGFAVGGRLPDGVILVIPSVLKKTIPPSGNPAPPS